MTWQSISIENIIKHELQEMFKDPYSNLESNGGLKIVEGAHIPYDEERIKRKKKAFDNAPEQMQIQQYFINQHNAYSASFMFGELGSPNRFTEEYFDNLYKNFTEEENKLIKQEREKIYEKYKDNRKKSLCSFQSRKSDDSDIETLHDQLELI